MIYKTKPYDHQIEGYKKLYGKEYFAEFMEQGTGKTKLAIDIACNLFIEKKINAVLLIAPNGVQEQWANEQIPEHSSIKNKVYIYSTKGGRLRERIKEDFLFFENENTLKWLCVHVDIFSSLNHIKYFQEYVLNHKVFIIVDESTRIKNPKANRTFNICYRLCRIKRHGKKIIDAIHVSKYRAILTGTMITNSPYDLWSMFEFLKHNYFGCNYYAFKARYGIEIRDRNPVSDGMFSRKMNTGEMRSIRKYVKEGKTIEQVAAIMGTTESNVKYIVENPELVVPYKYLEELKRMIEPVSYIVRKKDCLDLPPKVYEQLYVEMNKEQKRIYKELKQELLTTYQDKELTAFNKVSLIGRLQQITGGFFPYKEEDGKAKIIPISSYGQPINNPKIQALKRDLEETNESSIIIWARFVAEIKLLEKELTKIFPEKVIKTYYGGTFKENRELIRQQFQNGQIDILIANPSTAGIGLNLQRSRFHYYFSNSYSLERREQSEDRSHRIGQTNKVLYKDIVIKGTVDEKVLSVLKSKKDLLEYFREKDLHEFLGAV